MNEQYSALRSNVSVLVKVLGETIKDALGENILDRVETIRKLSKSSRAGNEVNRQELLTTLQNLSNDELLPVARQYISSRSDVSPLIEMVVFSGLLLGCMVALSVMP